jgi:hypothetical protein
MATEGPLPFDITPKLTNSDKVYFISSGAGGGFLNSI